MLALRTEPNTPDQECPEVGSNQGFVDTQELQESDIIVDFSVMHYGMKAENPLDFVKFYSKLDMNRQCCAVLAYSRTDRVLV